MGLLASASSVGRGVAVIKKLGTRKMSGLR